MKKVLGAAPIACCVIVLSVGCEPPGAGDSPGDGVEPTAADGGGAPSVYRLRNTAVLEAQRDSTAGYAAAAAAFREALELRFQKGDLLNLARVYSLADKWEDPGVDRWEEAWSALERYRQAAGGEASTDLPYLEGLVLKHRGEPARAAEKFREVTRRSPEVEAAWFQLGSELQRSRDFEGAVEPLRRVADSNAEHRPAHYKLYQGYLRLRKEEEAVVWEKKFLEIKAREEKEGLKFLESDYERCRFTEIRLVSTPRKGTEPPPMTLEFERLESPSRFGDRPVDSLAFLDAEGDLDLDLLLCGGGEARLFVNGYGFFAQVDGAEGLGEPSARDVRVADYDGDELIDVCFVRKDGRLSLFRRRIMAGFLPRPDAGLDGRGVVAARWVDTDHDGDLDLVTAESATGSPGERRPGVYQNRGDGTFARQDDLLAGTVAEAPDAYRFAVADLDLENDMDFVFPDPGGPAVLFLNLRRGPFRREEVPELVGHSQVLSLDLDGDGDMDLVGAPREGIPLRVAWNDGAEGAARLRGFRVESPEGLPEMAAVSDLLARDLDNDGDLDVLVAGSDGVVYLENREGGKLRPTALSGLALETTAGVHRLEAEDLDGDGDLDLAVLDASGKLSLWRNRTKGLPAGITLRLRGRRDNHRGVGSHIEIYSGRRFQRLMAEDSSDTHLGLGEKSEEDIDGISIRWPNGIRQSLLPRQLKLDRMRGVEVQQRPGLMISCPFLYVFDGECYRFLTDVVAIAPLDEWLPPGATPHRDPEEHVRIPGDVFRSRGGRLRAAITEELRETTYLDRALLIRVDHPRGTLVYTDESTRQGAVEPLRVFLVGEGGLCRPTAVRGRNGLRGDELTERVDHRYFHAYREGRPQWAGWVEPFSIDVDLPAGFAAGAPTLLLTGRIAWPDSGVAYALHQHGRVWSPHRLEVVQEDGSRRPGLDDVGFPSGLDRTLVVPLSGIIDASSRSLRLTATSRLFWDRIALAREVSSTELADDGERRVRLGERDCLVRSSVLPLVAAQLRYHGFSEVVGDRGRHEHVYDFARRSSWRDFPLPEGRATRHGDVRELALRVDDLLVVMTPGDGLFLEFEAGPEPAPGETVTYFLRLTGWAKESGFHNSTGRTIEPLPFRGMKSYPDGARRPPEGTAYRDYLRTYQTRRVRN
ncbi:MAG: FG-GAP-like repeat-containing protein [Planctomycetota bacterium]|nr:FG-GAP-like repeat-containing protein [Planctomycetota bacterium]